MQAQSEASLPCGRTPSTDGFADVPPLNGPGGEQASEAATENDECANHDAVLFVACHGGRRRRPISPDLRHLPGARLGQARVADGDRHGDREEPLEDRRVVKVGLSPKPPRTLMSQA